MRLRIPLSHPFLLCWLGLVLLSTTENSRWWTMLLSIEPHDVLKNHLSKKHGFFSLRQPNVLHFGNSPTGEKQAFP